MTKIGIFWVYKNTLIGRACNSDDGRKNVPGLIDSLYSHIDLWEKEHCFLPEFPELLETEYQEAPRGRAIYSSKDNKTIIYMDKTLHTDKTKKIVLGFFELKSKDVLWKTDSHYKTIPGSINTFLDI